MDQRDENVLVALTQQYAQPLLPMWDSRGTFDEKLPRLARGLASYNILVLMADQPYSLQNIQQNVGSLIQEWANHYVALYRRICQDLFPSFNQVSVHPTDHRWPIIIYLHGTATPVIQRMAGFVAPYIVERQFSPTVSEVELRGLMDLILDELEAGNLASGIYKKLRDDCIEILKHILATPVHQLSLTEFDRAIFSDSQRLVPVRIEPPTSVPETPPSILPPITPHPSVRQADTEQLMPTDIMPSLSKSDDSKSMSAVKPEDNSQFSLTNTLSSFRRDKDSGKKSRPPVPPLPKDKHDE
ncbi:MAG: hypothetical protein GC179_01295 [Anaerolineaceae bacterium]|nr:hypothetical protein [Anaerolineaceae bacterium]